MLMALKHHLCSESEKLAKPFEHCFAEESAVLSEQIFRIHFDEISLGQGKKQQLCSNIRKTHSSNVGNVLFCFSIMKCLRISKFCFILYAVTLNETYNVSYQRTTTKK